MRRAVIALLLCAPALAVAAGEPAGRWEGAIRIPGRELPLVVDLAPGAAGAWTGSLVMPGFGLAGAPLSNIVVGAGAVAFDLGSALRSPTYGPASFSARVTGDDRMTGELRQAGNVAPFTLTRVGRAEVVAPTRSTAVTPDLEAAWTGQFMLGDYPRNVTITVENHAGGPATATFVVVGKQTTDLPVDLVVEEGDFLRIESPASRVTFEGRIGKGRDEIAGSIDVGSMELPVVLRRKPRSAS
jgi:hypothetical protein